MTGVSIIHIRFVLELNLRSMWSTIQTSFVKFEICFTIKNISISRLKRVRLDRLSGIILKKPFARWFCCIFRQVPSSRRKVIPTAIRRVVEIERGRDHRSLLQIVEEVHRTPAIQTSRPVPTVRSPTADHERVTREVGITLITVINWLIN